MTPKFGPLGFQPDDRYRNLAEARVIDSLLTAGWPGEPETPALRDEAQRALETWIRDGVGFRRDANGARLFDSIEVFNHMKLAGVEGRDNFFSEKFSASRRKIIADFEAFPAAHFTVDFRRTFSLNNIAPGTKLRLRVPLPLASDHLSDLQVTPHFENAGISPGRLEARLVASGQTEVAVGATLRFTANRHDPAPNPAATLADRAPYLAEREGLIVITDRIRALAQSLASANAPALEAIRALWEHILITLRCGQVHYDQLDLAAPCDWVLDVGWHDCQLVSALFVALCRARGIPARMIGGYFLYPAAPSNHFWTEAWIDGQGWTPFDFFGWDISNAGRLPEWRDRFFARLEPRMVAERLPREFTGALGVPVPPAWCILQAPVPGGIEITLLDVTGAAMYTDVIHATVTPP